MHDIDRALFEMEQPEVGHEAYENFETFESQYETEATGNETTEFELTAGLLEITSEAELDRFLGNLISSAGSAIGSFVRSDAGRALGGLLKTAARRALPRVGRILGDVVAPGSGGRIGAGMGQWLGRQFEMEGLSAEDREFETARAFVRFAQDAARQTFETAGTAPPAVAAQNAAVAAAEQHAPALVPTIQAAQPAGGSSAGSDATSRGSTGRWVRHGNRVTVLGV
jgi:hypothetical protein